MPHGWPVSLFRISTSYVPSDLQVGGIKPGSFRIGNTGGMLDNIVMSKLYRPGSVAYVSKSGGMSNELNNIIARNSDGVYEGKPTAPRLILLSSRDTWESCTLPKPPSFSRFSVSGVLLCRCGHRW
jgi:hypothetical protein